MGKREFLVSVIITAYNEEEYLARAINSIKKQTFKKWETLIINDGSTDRTKKIAEQEAMGDERITLINIAHQGRAKALNTGLKNAKGRYIAILDADDQALPERLEKQVDFLEENKDVAIVGTYCRIQKESGQITSSIRPPTEDQRIRKALYTPRQVAYAHSSLMFRRSAQEEVGYYNSNEYLWKDLDFYMRMLIMHKAANIPIILTVITRRANSIMTKNTQLKRILRSYNSFSRAVLNLAPKKLIPFYLLKVWVFLLIKHGRWFK